MPSQKLNPGWTPSLPPWWPFGPFDLWLSLLLVALEIPLCHQLMFEMHLQRLSTPQTPPLGPSIIERPPGKGEPFNPLCLSHNGWLELVMSIWETTWKRCFYPGNCVTTDTSEDNLDHFCSIMILPCTVAQFLLLFCTAWLKMLESLNIFGITCWDSSTWCWPGGDRPVRSWRKPH